METLHEDISCLAWLQTIPILFSLFGLIMWKPTKNHSKQTEGSQFCSNSDSTNRLVGGWTPSGFESGTNEQSSLERFFLGFPSDDDRSEKRCCSFISNISNWKARCSWVGAVLLTRIRHIALCPSSPVPNLFDPSPWDNDGFKITNQTSRISERKDLLPWWFL